MKKIGLLFALFTYGSQLLAASSEISEVVQIKSWSQLFLNQSVLNKKFADGTPVETSKVVAEKDTGRIFFVEEGHVAETDDCRMRRFELKLTGKELRPVPPGVTETCTGKGCSHCVFKTRGGCKCKNSVNICEHTISRYNEDSDDSDPPL
jgi:hypothetical protein